MAHTTGPRRPRALTSYKVSYRLVGTSSWQNVTRANDDRSALQEINNLTNRNHYEVQVAAVNHVGTGQWASVKATPQAPHANPPNPIGAPRPLPALIEPRPTGLYWEISRTDNTLWGDSCTGLRSFRIIWDGPNGRDKRANEWAAHINTKRGAGAVDYSFRETPGDSSNYEMHGAMSFQGEGSVSINVRGRFGQTWAPGHTRALSTAIRPRNRAEINVLATIQHPRPIISRRPGRAAC